jgi:ribose-phosphate pyrophosphokinase
VVVAPDLGAVKRAERFAAALGLPTAVVHKQRLSGAEVAVHAVLGEVRGKRPILVDDLISTGGTLVAAARALLERGCVPELIAAATHLVLAGDAAERLRSLPLRRLVAADTLPAPSASPLPLTVVSIAPRLAEALQRLGG